MLSSIFDSTTSVTMSISQASICMAAALILGLIIAAVYMYCGPYTSGFAITLVILPILVEAVIIMVNGNLGTSVAVLGAFSLIRFRSVPGTSREIVSIFFSMAVGLAAGIGQIGYAALLTAVVCIVLIILHRIRFGEEKNGVQQLKIQIPDDLDYSEVFDDIFDKYTKDRDLVKVKTTNLGTMYQLTYMIHMKKAGQEKQMIDEIRCRNGNLTVVCGRPKNQYNAL